MDFTDTKMPANDVIRYAQWQQSNNDNNNTNTNTKTNNNNNTSNISKVPKTGDASTGIGFITLFSGLGSLAMVINRKSDLI